MKRLVLSLLIVLAGVVLLAQTPLTPLMNLKGTTDGAGNLMVVGNVASGSAGPLTPLANLRGTTDASGNLNVTIAGGTVTPTTILAGDGSAGAPSYSVASQSSLGFYKYAANTLGFSGGSGNPDFLLGPTGVFLNSSNRIIWSSGSDAGAGSDTILARNAAGKITLTGTTPMLQLGGTTSSFPAFKQSSTTLQARLADDSADASIQGIYKSTGSGLAVANVGANSCGTTAATIAGGNNAFVITVGATSGTQCRVTFTFAAATEWDCTVTDSTTTIATRATPVDTTHTDFFGAFVAADKVTGLCFPR